MLAEAAGNFKIKKSAQSCDRNRLEKARGPEAGSCLELVQED